MNRYTRRQSTYSALCYDFGLSEEESSGEEVKGTYTYHGSHVVDPDAIAALRSTIATDSLASSTDVDCLATSRGATKPQVVARISLMTSKISKGMCCKVKAWSIFIWVVHGIFP